MKKSIPQYIVDAFAERTFEGNPAAVCVLEEWLPEELLLDIARENNLSETAFLVREGEGWRLRWMTPGGEIDLCGHATLAAAFVLMSFEAPGREAVAFQTLSGPLTVCRRGDRYEMDFPAYALRQVPVTEEMAQAIGIQPLEAWMGRDLVCVLGKRRRSGRPGRTWSGWRPWRACCSTSPPPVGTMPASAAALPPSCMYRRTRCAAQATATLPRSGRKSWGGGN